MSTTAIEKCMKDTIPCIRLLAGCMDIDYRGNKIFLIGSSLFPVSPQEQVIARLTEEVCRAYSGTSQPLTTDNLTSRARLLTYVNSFHVEHELKQGALYCTPRYDDATVLTALSALENSRYLMNRYQIIFMVVLTIEVLARLVNRYPDIRHEFDDLSSIILNSNYLFAAKHIEKTIERLESLKKINLDIENAFKSAITGESNNAEAFL